MARIAIIGDRDSILALKALGVEIWAVNSAQEALDKLRQLATPDYGAVFITENYAEQLRAEMDDLQRQIAWQPSLVVIPDHKGSRGLGMQKIMNLIEKSLGKAMFQSNR